MGEVQAPQAGVLEGRDVSRDLCLGEVKAHEVGQVPEKEDVSRHLSVGEVKPPEAGQVLEGGEVSGDLGVGEEKGLEAGHVHKRGHIAGGLSALNPPHTATIDALDARPFAGVSFSDEAHSTQPFPQALTSLSFARRLFRGEEGHRKE